MDVREAAEFVRTLAMQPGWTVDAEPMPFSTSKLLIVVGVETANSNEYFAPSYSGDHFEASAGDVVDIAGLSKVELVGKVVKLILEKAAHETREFVRYYDPRSGRWVSPFHPHREEGVHNWGTGMAAPDLLSKV